MIVIPKYTVSKYDPDSAIPNERTDFTRRIPTGLSDKQMARDSKIIMQIIRADGDPSKVLEIFLGKARLLSNPQNWQMVKYGWLPAHGWQDILRKGFAECFRVLQSGGVLIFKWNETDIKLSEILKLTEQKPVFGHISGKRANTHWVCFMKPIE